jgi:uncharacterized protein involved in exopolysaccharide biosynthesis
MTNQSHSAEEVVMEVMRHFGFRRNYQVAEYFDITPQTLSGWIKTNTIPPKHYMKYEQEIAKPLTDKSEKNAVYVNFPAGTAEYSSQKKIVPYIISAQLIKKYKTILFILPILCASLSALYVFVLATPKFTSVTKVLPISNDNSTLSGFTGAAAQIGLAIPTGISSGTPWDELYPEIVLSENLMQNIIAKNMATNKYGSAEVLINILAREGHYTDQDDFIKAKLAIEDLLEMVSIQKFRMSPLVTLKVDAFEPQFAQDISNAILEESGVLLRDLKTRQIRAKRRFIEERLSEVSNEKKMMQEEIRDFREKNRNLNSPTLLMIEEEMVSELAIQNSVYITLKTQYEEAKIEEVAKTPMIQIIDGPIKPVKMTSPKPAITILLSVFLGFILTFISVYLREFSQRIESEETISIGA